ncbi:MAG: UDP-N-acetylmuramate--L-alanine ligase [Saprospiraceae bacterium]|nr:UDP-N-acetylmuramate--L-alanine ligase [Saprospiraceae bacterium]
MELNEFERVYFVGIGGIGMSALARYFNSLQIEVYGFDKVETVLTNTLVEEGIKVHYDEDVNQIPENVDLVIYTPAIPKDNMELNYFLNNNYTVMKRAEVLGVISRNKRTIGVAGTHGKTTTTAILTHILRTCGINCTSFLGGIAQNYNSNFVHGNSDWVVMEADEFDRSFLYLHPELAIVTSMDADHLDIYGDKVSLHKTFEEYVLQVSDTLFYKHDLPLYSNMNMEIEYVKYGINDGDCSAFNIRSEAPYFVFDWSGPETKIDNLIFSLAGTHNVMNATAAIAVAKKLGCNDNKIRESLLTFKGIKRRFELIVNNEEHIFIDDYAHHPEEIKVAISAARTMYPDKKITGVFQPHLYSRTRDFVNGFAEALDQLDELILMDIYPARELPIEGVTSQIIFEKMNNPNKVMIRKSQLLDELKGRELELLITLGAGDIGALVPDIDKMLMEN